LPNQAFQAAGEKSFLVDSACTAVSTTRSIYQTVGSSDPLQNCAGALGTALLSQARWGGIQGELSGLASRSGGSLRATSLDLKGKGGYSWCLRVLQDCQNDGASASRPVGDWAGRETLADVLATRAGTGVALKIETLKLWPPASARDLQHKPHPRQHEGAVPENHR